jgi:hypothetical protein
VSKFLKGGCRIEGIWKGGLVRYQENLNSDAKHETGGDWVSAELSLAGGALDIWRPKIFAL